MAINVYVERKSGITRLMEEYGRRGYRCYRTRLRCQCENCGNIRHGAVFIDRKGMHEFSVICCKGCKRERGQYE